MELASMIHFSCGAQSLVIRSSEASSLSPLTFQQSSSSSFHVPNFTRSRCYYSSALSSLAAPSRFALRHLTITCSRGVTNEDDLSTSEDLSNYAGQTSTADEVDQVTKSENYASSVRNVAFWVSTAAAFGVGLGLKYGIGKASEFFAGYLLEQSLSVDNLFVFLLVFKYFKVPLIYQNRVLSYGIAGAIVFRLSLILIGTTTLQRFEAVNLFLAGILLFSAFKLFTNEDDDTDLSNNFIVKTCQKLIPVTSSYDGNRFFTIQEGIRKA